MNSKEKQDYLKHCCEHYEILTGGRGHSKTKEVIEDMQKEIKQLKEEIKTLYRYTPEKGFELVGDEDVKD